MKIVALIAPILASILAFASRGNAELRYWGKPPEAAIGWIELGYGQYYEIGTGTDIPGWGRVKQVGADRLVVEQVRTEAEKRRLHERGALVTDVLEIHILREDLRHPQWGAPQGPHR